MADDKQNRTPEGVLSLSSMTPGAVVTFFIDKFGPISYGLAAVLVIWYVVVKPERVANDDAAAALRETSSSLQLTSENLKSTTRALEVTTSLQKQLADSLDSTAERLERLEQAKWDRGNP